MSNHSEFVDYEPVTRARRADLRMNETAATASSWPSHESALAEPGTERSEVERSIVSAATDAEKRSWILRRGHSLSYLGLFLFTAVLYFRPYELIPSLSAFSSMAFVIALLTLAVYFPSQLALEGNLTARPREVNLLMLLCLAALLSIPLAINRTEAWEGFSGNFVKVITMFIVMVNVVRTERRLKWMIFIALAISCVMSISAISNYAMGNLTVDGYRVDGYKVEGTRGNLFGNPNDMALHLVTMVPLALAFFLSRRDPLRKLLYLLCAILMVGGIAVTFSRSGFLGLMSAIAVMAWKIGRRRRLAVILSIFIFVVGFVVLAPSGYSNRLGSIVDQSRDPVHSSSARQALLFKSLVVAAANPLLGVGMNNFHILSIHEAVTHNAYTQVAAEMGLTALVLYVLFIITPIKKLRQIENETFTTRAGSRFYYLAVGLQASLFGYIVSSFFASVAYQWYVYYLVGYAVALRRIYAAAARDVNQTEAHIKDAQSVGKNASERRQERSAEAELAAAHRL
jgi:putative inorganic carbon (HCO3(-)) transporter